jgi:hypothetical protein
MVRNETLEPRHLFAAVAWDGGGDGSNWHDGSNWSTNQVPGAADDVTLNVAGNPEVVVRMFSTASVHSINSLERLSVYGTLNIAAPSTIQGGLYLRGTVGGDGDLNVTSSVLTCGPGGRLAGGGGVTIGSFAQMYVNGDWTLSRTLAMAGNCRWDSGTISMNGGTISNHGVWHCGYAPSPQNLVMRGTGGTNVFDNVGSFYADAGNTSFVNGPAPMRFDNFAAAHLTGGNFAALGGGAATINTDMTIDRADLTLTLGGNQQLQAGSRVTGPGRLQLTGGGTIESSGIVSVGTIASDATDAGFTQGTVNATRIEVTGGGETWFVPSVSFQSGLVSGGRLGEFGNMTFTSHLDWTGGILGGNGHMVIPPAAQVNIFGTAFRLLNGYLDVNGTALWTEGGVDMGGTLTNNGTFRIEPASVPLTMRDTSFGHGSSFVNNGSVLKRNAAATTLDVAVTQNGGIVVEQGELKLASGGAHTTGATNRANPGATLALNGSYTFANNGSFNSFQGTLRIEGGTSTYGGGLPGAENITFAGGTFTLGGAPARTLDFTGGTGVINGNGTVTGGSMSAGEWRGSGNVTLSSFFSWTGGTIGGTGTLTTAAPDSVLEISGADIHHVARPMVLRGYTNWLGGDIDVTETGSIRNDGNFGAMNETGTVRLFRSGGGAPFVNNGTFAKFFGGEARIDGTFNNAGQVTISGGSVALAQGGIQSGDFNVAGGATLELGGGHNLGANSNLTGAGDLALRGAIVNVAADQAFDGDVTVDGSSLVTFAGAHTELGALTIDSFGSAGLATGGGRLLVTRSLHVDPLGRLDLADNDMILDYTGASPLAAVQAWINQGRNGGAWDGKGITSTAAQANAQHNATLGAMASADWDAIYGAAAPFNGINPDTTALLVKYTYYGDADFNGKVNFDDYVRTDLGFNNHRTGWTNGDFDGNGMVNFDDYVLLDLGFNTQGQVL